MNDLMEEAKQAIIEQRSQAWYRIRLGRFTASEVWKLLTEPKTKEAKEKGEWSAQAKTYILDKVAETLTGFAKDFTSDATVWGIENEHLAREWYRKLTGYEAKEAEFIEYGKDAGGSSDGFVGNDGMIEIKCPFNTTNHLQHCLATDQKKFKENFKEHYYQIQANLLFSDRLWCDFISFDPRIQKDVAYFRLRIESDAECQQKIRAAVDKAIHQKQLYLEQFEAYSLDALRALQENKGEPIEPGDDLPY